MSESSVAVETVADEAIFRHCAPAALARFLPALSMRSLKAGETLLRSGEAAQQAYFLVSGRLRVLAGRGDAHHMERGFVGQEGAIGLDCYLLTAQAVDDSVVLEMPTEAVDELARSRAFRKELSADFANLFNPDKEEEAVAEDAAAAEKAAPTHSAGWISGWFLVLLLPLLAYWLMSEYAGFSVREPALLSAIFSAAVVMWVFRLLPDFVPSIFAILCVVLLGVAPPDVALSGFSSSTFFMALSIFGLSAVISVSGLSYRMLLWLLRIGPASKSWYFMSLFLSGALLSVVVPTTNGRVAIVTPFIRELLTSFDAKSARSEAPRLSVAVLGGCTLLSAIFLSSKSVNFLLFGLLPLQEQARFQWVDWLISASVAGGVLLLLYLVIVAVLFRNNARPSIPKQLIVDQLRLLGPMRGAEWAGLSGLLVLLLSVLTASLHHIEVPWVALAILFSLLLFDFLGKDDFRHKVDWSFLVFLGSLIGLVATIRHVELDMWITAQLNWLTVYMKQDFPLFILLLSAAIVVVRLALPINATVVIFASVFIPVAVGVGVNPWIVGFVILMMAEGFIWPFQASYYMQFLSMAGPDSGGESGRVLVMNAMGYLIKLAAIYASIPYWQHLGLL